MSDIDHTEHIADHLSINDRYGGLRGELICGRGRHLREFTDPFGNRSWRTEFDEVLFREGNIVPIGGYQFVFSKLFNIAFDDPLRSNLKLGDLNSDYQMRIGVNPQHYRLWDYNAETREDGQAPIRPGINMPASDFVFGFMIGDGGAREDNITPIAPDYKRRQLFHAIPFMVTERPDVEYAERYFGRFTDLQGTTSFYVKRFETTGTYPHIVHAWVTDDKDLFQPVDESVFSSTSSTPIESYVEMLLRLDAGDGSTYFKRTNSTRRINEIGLVSGWYNPEKKDYERLKLLTHFTRPSIILVDDDWVDIVYRLYAR